MDVKPVGPRRVNQLAFVLVLKELLDGPATQFDLAEASGLHMTTVQSLMSLLVRQRTAHIVGWHPDVRGIPRTPIIKLGAGTNVKRPLKSGADVMKAYRARNQQKLLTIHSRNA